MANFLSNIPKNNVVLLKEATYPGIIGVGHWCLPGDLDNFS